MYSKFSQMFAYYKFCKPGLLFFPSYYFIITYKVQGRRWSMQLFHSNKKVTLIFLISLKSLYNEVRFYFSRKIVETFNNLNAILFLSMHFFKQCIFYNSASVLLNFLNKIERQLLLHRNLGWWGLGVILLPSLLVFF